MDVSIVGTVSLSVSSNGGFFWQICVIWWKNIWYIFSKFIFFDPTNHCCHYPYGCYHENNFTFWLPLRRTNCHLAEEGSSYNGDDKTTKCIRALFTVLLLLFFYIFTFSLSKSFMEISMKAPVFPMLNIRSSKIISILFCCRLSFAQ